MSQKSGNRSLNVDGDAKGNIMITGDGNTVNLSPDSSPAPTNRLSLAGVIALICVVMFGMYGLLIILLRFLPPVAITPTASPPGLVFETPTVAATVTATEQAAVPLEAVPSPSSSPEPVVLSPTPPADRMVAILQSNRTEGKAPFEARFDGRASYVYRADGQVNKCIDLFFCTYTFTVYLNDKYVTSTSNKTGIWQYTFGKRGEYKIGVYVCWDQVCGEDGVAVNAR